MKKEHHATLPTTSQRKKGETQQNHVKIYRQCKIEFLHMQKIEQKKKLPHFSFYGATPAYGPISTIPGQYIKQKFLSHLLVVDAPPAPTQKN